MNRKLTATLLIAAAVLTNAAFTVLGTVFNYPDVLGEPVEDILAAFRANQTTVVAWFAVMALSAALFAPIAIGVGRLSTHRAMRIAVPVGNRRRRRPGHRPCPLALLVPGFAADAASSDPAIAAAARDSFLLAHRILGTVVGETLGYLLTAAWTAAGPGRSAPWDCRRWFTALGAVSAVLILSGMLTPLHLPVVDNANFIGYVMWSVWLVIFAILILRHHPRSRAAAPEPVRSGAQEGGDIMTASASRLDTFWWSWLIWTAGFLAFPIAGVAGRHGRRSRRQPHRRSAGRPGHRRRHRCRAVAGQPRAGCGPRRWILATALGMGAGPAARRDSRRLPDLPRRPRPDGGTHRRLVLGIAQTLALPAQTRRRWWWAVAMPLLWALGWTVTTLAGIPVEQQFTIFGASGAVTFSALSGLLLHRLLPVRSVSSTGPARVDARVVSKL